MVVTQEKLKTWTLTEVEALMSHGLFDDAHRYELIEGRIIEKCASTDAHLYGIRYVGRALSREFGVEYPTYQQSPLKFFVLHQVYMTFKE